MTLTIKHVSPQFTAQAWPLVAQFISNARLHDGGDYTLEQIRLQVNTGKWLLLVLTDEKEVIHGAATVSFTTMPNDHVAFITYSGGKAMSTTAIFDQLKSVLKQYGATKVQAATRKSVARLMSRYGFEERHTIVECKL